MILTANALGRETPYGVSSEFACYLNETMNGFEYQVAAHMIAEGMVKEGLAVLKTLDERYDGNKRNPFNEVECGDHYARSMASYGALIAISGFEYDGPERYIGFAPRLTPENFKAPFTAAEGWGSYSQKIADGTMRAELAVKHGKVPLRTLSLAPLAGQTPRKVSAALDGKNLLASLSEKDGSVLVAFDPEITVDAGQKLEVTISAGS
jgi:hypothetical protein